MPFFSSDDCKNSETDRMVRSRLSAVRVPVAVVLGFYLEQSELASRVLLVLPAPVGGPWRRRWQPSQHQPRARRKTHPS